MNGVRVWVSQTCPGDAERPAWSSQLLHRPSSKTSGLHPAGFRRSTLQERGLMPKVAALRNVPSGHPCEISHVAGGEL